MQNQIAQNTKNQHRLNRTQKKSSLTSSIIQLYSRDIK